jgi:hypothetical protein
MIVFLEKEQNVASFTSENSQLFETIRQQQALEGNKFAVKIIYHSVPLSVIHNPLYRLELMAKWEGMAIKPIHVLDVLETNRP